MRNTMRGGEEHHIAGAQGSDVRHAERQVVVMTAQVRVHLIDTHAGLGARGNHLDLRLRVLRQQTQQLDTGIPRATDDSDLDHHLPLCNTSSGKLPMIRPLRPGANT